MSVDLDDLFTTLGRHADTIPLAPPDRARRRGRQRTRSMVAVAAAVCLIAAGAGVVVRHERQTAPVTSDRGLTAVGEPIEFGGQARASTAAGTDGRLYTAWQTLDGRIQLNAVELRTGAVVWPAQPVGERTDTLGSVRALPQGLLVTLEHEDPAVKGSILQIHDPASGGLRWQLPYAIEDALVPHESVLVWMSAKTGRTTAFDWVTGEKRWDLPPPADRPVRTLGTYLDENWTFALGRPAAFTDDHLVQVTRAGQVQLRDITTGGLIRTVTDATPDRDPRMVMAYGTWLYSGECCADNGYRIRRTDLRVTQGGSTTVLTEGAGREFDSLQPCGDQRLCVLDRDRDNKTTVSAVDVPSGRRLWRVGTPGEAGSVATVHGYTLVGGPAGDQVVYDRDGRQVYSTAAAMVDWLAEDTLLLLPGLAAGPAIKVALPEGRETRLGEVPAPSDPCAWTPERLACPTITSLRIWDLTG